MIDGEGALASLDAILLVGGQGTRLREALPDRPKAMAVVGGKPFVEWLLLALHAQGVRRAVLATGHMGEVIERYFGTGAGVGLKLTYSRDPTPLGTGGAVRACLGLVRSTRLLVLNGDSYCWPRLEHLVTLHRHRRAQATLWLVRVRDARRYGIVELTRNGAVSAFREKSSGRRGGLVNGGVYVFERPVVEEIPSGRPVSLERETLPSLIGQGLHAVVGRSPLVDIGTPAAYAHARRLLSGGLMVKPTTRV